MKKSILEIYSLAVCFVTIICFVVSLGIALYGIIGIANPEFTMPSLTYTQHQTNDEFWSNNPENFSMPMNPGETSKAKERPSEAILTKQREESFARAVSNERRDNAQTVVKTIIVIFIDLIVFLFHWFIARRVRSNVN